jgi:hypothetical protein
MLTRRQFLAGLIPALALLSGGFAYVGYRCGGCPLSSEGRCVGPCSALRDGDGNGLCDRVAGAEAGVVAAEPKTLPTDAAAPPQMPVPSAAPSATSDQPSSQQPTAKPKPTTAPTKAAGMVVACPFGRVNDKYPGRCGRYVDRNGNGICDLSEPQ